MEESKLSEELRFCLEGNGCKDCSNYQPESRLTCPKLIQKAYEVVKRYEEMFPCAVGDKIYYPNKFGNRIVEFEIIQIKIFKEETIFFDDSGNEYHAEDFGKTFYLTREQAENKLNETEDNDG